MRSETLPFVSLLLPAAVILLGVDGLAGASGIEFWPIWAGAVFGAALGDWISYWLGYHNKEAVGRIWPLAWLGLAGTAAVLLSQLIF